MPISVKDSGSIRTPTAIWVKKDGDWKRIKRVKVKSGGSWRDSYRSTWYYTFTSNQNQVDLDNLSGIDKFMDVEITINSGVYIYSNSTSVPAFKTGSGYGGTLKIINNGFIFGCGGSGGGGGAPNSGAGGGGGTGHGLRRGSLS